MTLHEENDINSDSDSDSELLKISK
jgi:hypothetical protein